MTLKLAVPNKGRLLEETLELLRSVGLRVHSPDRTLISTVNGGRYQILFARAQDIPEYVETGAVHAGITGSDLVEETGVKVRRVLDLGFGACKLVLAAPEQAAYASVADLPNNARVATSFPNLARRYFEKRRQKVSIVPISGAAELTPYIGVSDAIVDLTQTGTTLKQNHLALLDVIFESSAALIAPDSLPAARRQDLEDFAAAVESVRVARGQRYLMANFPEGRVKEAAKLLPGVNGPTVMKLASEGLVAVHAVVDEDDITSLVPRLKKLGATGILVLPIERMVP